MDFSRPITMENQQISILMPFKDTAQYLPDCLSSIRIQTHTNWELLAVDDHSTDGSLEVVRAAAVEDDRIRVFDNPGSGIIPALRQAFTRSKGAFVTRMDSDDLMTPDRLAHMHGQLRDAGPGHLALGQVTYFSDRGISDGYARYERWLNGLSAHGANFTELYKECVIPSPCWMVYRQDLMAAGDFRPDRYPEDYDLAFRFYEAGLSCLPADRVLLHWRDYDARTSRNSEHYAQNYFLELKLHYFLKLHLRPTRPLVVWGAGFKGKKIARLLKKEQQAFRWVCDNPNKIGKKIYGVPLEHFDTLDLLSSPQSIVTVANQAAQREIQAYLQARGQSHMQDYFFFC